jgi:hypothetical protein
MAGNANSGRSHFGEEVKVIEHFKQLSEPYFAFLKEQFEIGTKEDRWRACEILKGAYAKMIPQDITSGGKELPAPILANALPVNNSNQEDSGDDQTA